MGLRMHRQVDALWKVLSQQAIGVLVRPALPRALRIAKIYVAFGRQRKAAMIRKFLSPVPGQGLIQKIFEFCAIQILLPQPSLHRRDIVFLRRVRLIAATHSANFSAGV
jgi:hypothetical protein